MRDMCKVWRVSSLTEANQGQGGGDLAPVKADPSPCHLPLSPLPPGSLLQPTLHPQSELSSKPSLIPSLSNFKASISTHNHNHPQSNIQTLSVMDIRPFSGSQRVLENLTPKEENSLVFIPDAIWVLGLKGLNTPEHNLP